MRTDFFHCFTLFLLVVVVMMFDSNCLKADTGMKIGTIPISYGYVYSARLSDLAPANNVATYDLLANRHFAEAVPGLEQELAQHPDSLSAYVGLMQIEPTRWPSEIKRLQAKIARQRSHQQEPRPTDLFKLGTLLFYVYGQDPPPPNDFKPLAQAQTLLGYAWRQVHLPIIGLMLTDTLTYGVRYTDSSLKGLTAKAINSQLLMELAGSVIYAKYLYAKQQGWHAEAPAASSVLRQNLRPLSSVVWSLHNLAGGRTGTLKVINGKPTMVDFPVPASQIAEEHYLKDWYDNLITALKS